MSLGAGMDEWVSVEMGKHPVANSSDTTRHTPEVLPRSPVETTSPSGAHNESLQLSTVQNQPRQIHQWLGLSHLAVLRSRCGVRLPLALLCVWGPQESLTLHLWGRAYNKAGQVLSPTHGWGPDSVTGKPRAVLWLLNTCALFLVFSLIKALKAHISLQGYWEAVWSHSLTPPAFIC